MDRKETGSKSRAPTPNPCPFQIPIEKVQKKSAIPPYCTVTFAANVRTGGTPFSQGRR